MAEVEFEMELGPLIQKAVDGQDLTAPEAESAIDRFMDGSATEIQMAALLTALRAKGVRPSEVAGGVRALRRAMRPVHSADPGALVDTAGTGGGGVTTFNISTAAALVAAGAGVKMAKHGNRSFTSRSGSADVLEALGVGIELTPARMADVLAEAGIVFMFAPLLHPAMRHVGPVRRGLGFTTLMNLLGPLTNPAGARRQVIGVAEEGVLPLVAGALAELDHAKALVVYGAPGMDEVSPCGTTRIAEVVAGQLSESTIEPEALGLERCPPEALRGGEPAENAQIILDVLGGASGGARTAVVLNAAAAIYVSPIAGAPAESGTDPGDGHPDPDGPRALAGFTAAVRTAERSIDDGLALAALERLRAATA